jgi:8-oxo-dGTP pyrophosphatase MutT (NUDIX family)
LAATIMLLRPRDPAPRFDVFMLRRSTRSSFQPNVYVFPGGTVDRRDAAPEMLARLRRDGERDTALAPQIAVAAIRELFEEAGVLLACDSAGVPIAFDPNSPAGDALEQARVEVASGRLAFDALLDRLNAWADGRSLTYYSHWITPVSEPRRFDTHFFIAQAQADQVAEADRVETHDGLWIEPATALRRYQAGEFALIFPTIKHLERLAAQPTIDAVVASAREKRIVTVIPTILADRGPVLPEDVASSW